MPKQQLSYPEKLQLLSDLRDFYMKDFWIIYDDTPEELWHFKWLSIWLVLDILKPIFKSDSNPTEEEILFVLSRVLDENFLNELLKDKDEKVVYFTKSWFWCALGILLWDKHIINIEKEELEKVWWLEINCSLL